MKRVIIALIIMCLVIPAISGIVATDETVKPFEWVEYGTYELSAKETSKMILIIIYEDISLDYKGWNPEISEESHREIILNSIHRTVLNFDHSALIDLQKDIAEIQIKISNWILNLDKKDYTKWIDFALIYLDNPDEIIESTVQIYSGCCAFSGWNNCYEWLQ